MTGLLGFILVIYFIFIFSKIQGRGFIGSYYFYYSKLVYLHEIHLQMWKLISGKEPITLETISEEFESGELEAACNIQDPADGNTALHKAAIAEKPDMVT